LILSRFDGRVENGKIINVRRREVIVSVNAIFVKMEIAAHKLI
jgi:hypothetical protein